MTAVARKKKKAAPKKKAAKKPAAKKTAKKAAKKRSTKSSSVAAKKGKKAVTKKAKAKAKKTTAKRRPAAKPAAKTAKKKTKKTKKKVRARPVMTPKQLAHFRAILEKKQKDLTKAYQISKGDSQSDLDDGTEDYIDYAVHSYAREFLLSLTELERKQLFLVEAALERVNRREFGNCRSCGKKIHEKRLEVAPWAAYCVPCQELDEQGLLPQPGFEDRDREEAPPEDEAEAEDPAGPTEKEYEGELDIEEESDDKGNDSKEELDDNLRVKRGE
jgi:DnaK suppressor protein